MNAQVKKLLLGYLSLDTSGKNYGQAARMLGKFLGESGWESEYLKIPEKMTGRGRVNLIARKSSRADSPTLLIYNHMDVVPGNYANAFDPKISRGKVYARGAADHKAGTVAVMAALRKLAKKELRFNTVFIATCDEETGQSAQLEYLFDHLKLPQNTLCFDTDTYAGGVTIARLSRTNLTIRIKGKATHAATPHLGVNAAEQAVRLAKQILAVKPKFEARRSKLPSIPKTSRLFATSKLSVNQIESGHAHNVLPDQAMIKINCRFIPEDDAVKKTEMLLKIIDKFCQKHSIDYEIIYLDTISSGVADHPEIRELERIYRRYERTAGLGCVLASNPLTDICLKRGWQQFGIGLFREDNNVHGVDEFAYLSDLEKLTKTVTEFLGQS